jgi:hypothetical protein
VVILGVFVASGCESKKSDGDKPTAKPAPTTAQEVDKPKPAAQPVAPVAPVATAGPSLGREDFNRMSVLANLPIVWSHDGENPGTLDPAELAVVRGDRAEYVADGKLTDKVSKVMAELTELRRQDAVRRELDQSRVTVISSDFSKLTDEDRAVMKHLATAGELVDALFRKQTGAAALESAVAKDDSASQALFLRNNGPQCGAPGTVADELCSAIPSFQKPHPMAWPTGATLDQAFCDAIGKEPNAKELLDPFTVVRKKGDGYEAKSNLTVYGTEMKSVADALKAAAGAISDEKEAAFKAYLLAAAKGFETNVWWDADEAWSKMSGENSAWYLRIGPDETYFDPCQVKSGFHMSLARVDQSALEWQKKLTAMRSDMENYLAELIGEPYKARAVGFKLPEFINIIINSGNSRSARGGTIGQSLPNFGKVAEESRGRTVAMANLYGDPDSMRISKARADSLFTTETLKAWSVDPEVSQLDTVLHEAMHNFGPTGSWKVDGKTPEAIFGGRLDAIMEELKAQTGSYTLLSYLNKNKHLSDEELASGFMASLAWTMGHIANGMFTPTGKPRTYSVLSGIQLKAFVDAGALRWEPAGDGRYAIDFAKVGPAADALMKVVGSIKARGDRAAAQAMVDAATSPEAQKAMHFEAITERVHRFPKASFVYEVRYQ